MLPTRGGLASSPIWSIPELPIVMNMLMRFGCHFSGNTTTFLHAILNPEQAPIAVWPPGEYYPKNIMLWRLQRAVYGLRNVVRDWQGRFPPEMEKSGIPATKARSQRLRQAGVLCCGRSGLHGRHDGADDVKKGFQEMHNNFLWRRDTERRRRKGSLLGRKPSEERGDVFHP